jgi:Rad3-related DNA helicase
MKHNTNDANKLKWVEEVDRVIEPRLDKRGILHAVSYERARFLARHSRFREHFLLHEPGSAQQTVQKFKRTAPPVVLVSPVVHTGYDFPYEDARWQIIAKVPFPDLQSRTAQVRLSQDQLWAKKFAARTIVQMAGRVVRSERDLGETIIVDDTFSWLYTKNKPLFPRWFREAVTPVPEIPTPSWRQE